MVSLRTRWKDSPRLYIPIEPQESAVWAFPTGNYSHLIKVRVRNIRLLTDTRMECIWFNCCRVGEDPPMCCALGLQPCPSRQWPTFTEMISFYVGIFDAALVVKVCSGVSWLRSRHNDIVWPQRSRKEHWHWKIIQELENTNYKGSYDGDYTTWFPLLCEDV
jgi:hypothetical protein